MNTLRVPPLLGGPPLHDLTGSLGNRTKPSVMRGSELWKSGFGPPLDGIYVGSGPLAPAAAGAGVAEGLGVGAAGAQACSSAVTPAPAARAVPVEIRINPRRVTMTSTGLSSSRQCGLEFAFVTVPQLLEIALRRGDIHRR